MTQTADTQAGGEPGGQKVATELSMKNCCIQPALFAAWAKIRLHTMAGFQKELDDFMTDNDHLSSSRLREEGWLASGHEPVGVGKESPFSSNLHSPK